MDEQALANKKKMVLQALRDRRILGVQLAVIDKMIPAPLSDHLAITMRTTIGGGVTFSLIYFFFLDMTKGHVVLRQDVPFDDIKADLDVIVKNKSLHHFDILAGIQMRLTDLMKDAEYVD